MLPESLQTFSSLTQFLNSNPWKHVRGDMEVKFVK